MVARNKENKNLIDLMQPETELQNRAEILGNDNRKTDKYYHKYVPQYKIWPFIILYYIIHYYFVYNKI